MNAEPTFDLVLEMKALDSYVCTISLLKGKITACSVW